MWTKRCGLHRASGFCDAHTAAIQTRYQASHPVWGLAARDDLSDGRGESWALLQGRGYVTPEDVKNIGPDVLRHRIILTYEAEAQATSTDDIIKKIFSTVPVP